MFAKGMNNLLFLYQRHYSINHFPFNQQSVISHWPGDRWISRKKYNGRKQGLRGLAHLAANIRV